MDEHKHSQQAGIREILLLEILEVRILRLITRSSLQQFINETGLIIFVPELIMEIKAIESEIDQETLELLMSNKNEIISNLETLEKLPRNLNLVDFLIQRKQFRAIEELLLSETIRPDIKNCIIMMIVDNYPEKLNELFNVPSTSYFYKNSGDSTKAYEAYKSDVNLNLKSAFPDKRVIIDYIKYRLLKIDSNSKYDNDDNKLTDLIRFFVEHNLIDPNQEYLEAVDDEVLTLAAYAMMLNCKRVGMYLYQLPTYVDVEPHIREYSDNAILEYLLKKQDDNMIYDFLETPSFKPSIGTLQYFIKLCIHNFDRVDEQIMTKFLGIFRNKSMSDLLKDEHLIYNPFIQLMDMRNKKVSLRDGRLALLSILKQMSQATVGEAMAGRRKALE